MCKSSELQKLRFVAIAFFYITGGIGALSGETVCPFHADESVPREWKYTHTYRAQNLKGCARLQVACEGHDVARRAVHQEAGEGGGARGMGSAPGSGRLRNVPDEGGCLCRYLIPQGSYLRDFLSTRQDEFAATGTELHLYWVNNE